MISSIVLIQVKVILSVICLNYTKSVLMQFHLIFSTYLADVQSKKHASKTAVTKIPSLSRVGEPSSLLIDVAGQDQLEVHVLGRLKKTYPNLPK